MILFNSSFDLPYWEQGMGSPLRPSITKSGDWTTAAGSKDQITEEANNPLGTGKGFRHWIGDGVNNGGGGLNFNFSQATPEFWLRYYIRYPLGFTWGGGINHKQFYVKGTAGSFYFGLHQGYVGGHVTYGGSHHSQVSWSQYQGGVLGDGQFHCLEVHAKVNPVGGVAGGVLEYWLDNVPIYSDTSVNFSNASNTTYSFIHTSNHATPMNGGDVPVDYDDIVVATERVGPIG